MHGRGKCFLYANERYEGEYKNGKMHGFGTIFSPNGFLIQGMWNNGIRNGEESVIWLDGERY